MSKYAVFRNRTPAASTPIVVVGSLLVALGLTAFGDTQAQAQRPMPSKHARLAPKHDATELRVLDWTLWNVSKFYVDPKRIDPRAMTLAGLEALENTIPEVLIEVVGSGKRVRARVGTAEREFQIGDVEALWAVGPHIREVFRFVTDNTDLNEKAQRSAEYAIVAGVLSTLDPHTNLLRPEDFEDMKASTKGSFGGLGIEVGVRDGGLTVIRVLDGNPAAKVDMQPGDRIVQIDEQSTVTMSLTDAVALLRGPPGTTVTVHVIREGFEKPKPLKITRATIQLDSVVADILHSKDAHGRDRKVGLIRIPRSFAQTTSRELRAKLEEFEQAGVEGLVLDLRDNPGGLLNAAIEVADAFLSRGTIVATVGSNPASREESAADDRYDFRDVPMVVLVDQGSASASEIVAGALRNLDRAVVLGRRTFGKGSVQVLHERKAGDDELALKLTIAQYLTPGDMSIQSVGVSPDLETIPVYIGEEHIQFFGRNRFDLLREESLDAHLESETAQAQSSPFGPLYFLDQGSIGQESKNSKGAGADARSKIALDDAEVRIANDLLLWASSARRTDILQNLDDFVQRQAKIEQERIATALGKRAVDWTPGAKGADEKAALLRVAVETDKPGNAIRGGDSGILTVRVTNTGDAPAYQVRAITDSDYRYFDERELLFGKIDPGQTKEYSIKLSVAEHELSRTDRIDLHLFEQRGARLARESQTSIDIGAEGLPRPHFAFGYQLLDDPSVDPTIKGNGDGALQVGERAKLRVEVKNVGDGPALETWVTVRNMSGDSVFLNEGRAKVDRMQPGQSRVAILDLEIKKAPTDAAAELQLSVSDNKIAEVLSERVVFPVLARVSELSAASTGVEAKSAVALYASPLTPERIVAKAAAGSRFKATAAGGGWYRLALGKDMFAFARSADVAELGRPESKPGKYAIAYEVSPPRVELVTTATQTDGKHVHISGVVSDEEAVRDVFITVYNPSRDLFGSGEKVFYQAAKNPADGRLEFAADVPLTPGNNLIEIHARENDDVTGVRRMWVLRTSGLAEARAKESKYSSNGKLRVDTFK